jgi:hypothetical protein
MNVNGYIMFHGLGISAGHTVFDPYNPLLLHIQMEFCSKTLTFILKKLKEKLKLSQNDLLTSISYYIASELSIELLESVESLHKHNLLFILI